MKLFFTLFFAFICCGCFCQNLILNPGFESFQCAPWFISSIEICDQWSSPTLQTPDYFNNACEKYKASTYPDKHWWGPQLPHSGNSYVGIIAFRPNHKEVEKSVAEYLQVKLSEPLKRGIKYNLSLYISFSESSLFSLKTLEVYVSDKKINTKAFQILPYKPSMILTLINDTALWVKVHSSFIAHGEEEFLIIGCMPIEKKVKIKKVKASSEIKSPRSESYYFIDDVILLEEGKANQSDICFKEVDTDHTMSGVENTVSSDFSTNEAKPIILKNVFFKSGDFTLLPQSFPELNKLVKFLIENKRVNLEITGYTDNTGENNDNDLLSLNRAMAIANYITEKNIDNSRIKVYGLGSKDPVFDNATEEGRAKNRRVEIIIINQK